MVKYDDGRTAGYIVWTTEYFQANIQNLLAKIEEDGFTTGPDIIVSTITREHLTKVLKELIPRSEW